MPGQRPVGPNNISNADPYGLTSPTPGGGVRPNMMTNLLRQPSPVCSMGQVSDVSSFMLYYLSQVVIDRLHRTNHKCGSHVFIRSVR